MTTFARLRVLAGLVAVFAGLFGGTASAQNNPAAPPPPPTPDVKVDPKTGALIVPLGGAVRFDPKAANKAILDTFIRNDDVLQVRPDPLNPRVLVLSGRQAGATQITITFEDKTKAVYDVVVQPDYDLLRNILKRVVPTANIDVIPGVGNSLILAGYVTRPEDVDSVVRIASSAVGGTAGNVINALQIGGLQHVLIDVTIAQIDRTLLRNRGFSFGVQGSTFGASSVLNGLATDASQVNIFGGTKTTPPLVTGATANIVAGIVPAGTVGALQALKTEGFAQFLSEPKLITQTGRPAQLRSGGQQAVLGPASGINGPGVVLQDVGTTLDVLPIVFGNGKIYLEVAPTFRFVNNGRGVTTSFGFTPGFNEQSTKSSILMETGQTFAIGGLLETQRQATALKVPILGELPIVGTLFSSVSDDFRETELLIMVTPHLVDSLDCTQKPKRLPSQETRRPDDYELFLESLVEAPRGQRKVWTNRGFNAAWRCDTSATKYPCEGNVCGKNGCGAGTVPVGGCSTGNCNGGVIAPVAPGTWSASPVVNPMTMPVPPQAPAQAPAMKPVAPLDSIPPVTIPTTSGQPGTDAVPATPPTPQ